MSTVECFTRLFYMMHIIITELFHFFIWKKDTHVSKSFYISLTAKNLVLNVRDSATFEEEESSL